MRLFRMSLFLVLIGGLVLFSCSEDKKDDGTNATDTPPEGVSITEIEVPPALLQSTNQYAQMAVGTINFVNSFKGYVGFFNPNVGLQSDTDGPPWVYTWSDGGLTITLTITIEDNQYHWVLTFNGTDGEMQYNNFVMYEAWQNLDGTYGKLVVYDPEYQNISSEWTWVQDDQGVITVTFINHYDQSKIIVTQNQDLSGTLEVYENNILTMKISWNADGSGNWWTYDDDGTLTGSGSWT
ncbi:hypothetical protein Calab_1664 [Caldithrix abyssi DSM 13497]|uniref:YD repeat-containing protein n=2 Tax=Caldithrix abyssi DSM 13497 TaxID=880073 RepID=H1XRS2_CALAY|nr:hypothetical protein [Caldithrix abyssi]EHO41282.1 hypothetical protein Calab_1664 [Caldithrix abyssi DSM 13497]